MPVVFKGYMDGHAYPAAAMLWKYGDKTLAFKEDFGSIDRANWSGAVFSDILASGKTAHAVRILRQLLPTRMRPGYRPL